MPLIILHDLQNEEVMINTDTVTAAKRRFPDNRSHIKEEFTKLYFLSKDKTIAALGFPDAVRESPAEIVKIAGKKA